MISRKIKLLISSLVAVLTISVSLLSCEKEFSIAPTEVREPVVGKVISSIDQQGIQGAKLTFTLLENGKKYSGITIDTAGTFNVPIDIIPDNRKFEVLVEAQGFVSKDTTVLCGCTNLIIPMMGLQPSNCDVSISPQTLDFQNTVVGNTYTKTITLINSTPVNLPITSLSILPSDGELIINGLPTKVNKNSSVTFTAVFTPKSEKKYNYKLKIFTVCGVSNEMSVISEAIANSSSRKCSYQPTISNFYDFTKRDSLQTITINNESPTLDLAVSYLHLPQNPPFTVSPAISFTIPPMQSQDIKIYFSPLAPISTVDSLVISTNGSCGNYVFHFSGVYNLPVFQKVLINKWPNSITTNPQYLYHGFRFSTATHVPDTTHICSSDPNINKVAGDDSADVRFDGYDLSGYYYGNTPVIYLKAAKGLQKLGNLVTDRLTFEVNNYQYKISPTKFTDGCGMSFSKYDVIAIRTRDNKYAILLVELADHDYVGYEFLMVDYFYPVQ